MKSGKREIKNEGGIEEIERVLPQKLFQCWLVVVHKKEIDEKKRGGKRRKEEKRKKESGEREE